MKDTIKKLKDLYQLDVDAVEAYGQAIKNITHDEIKNTLIEFQNDHKQHIVNLRQCIRNLGETPPEEKPDMMGYMLQTFTAVRSITGTEGALNAMHRNEQKTNSEYEQALSGNLSEEIRAIVQKNYSDEQRHLAYIERALKEKIWESTEEDFSSRRTSA